MTEPDDPSLEPVLRAAFGPESDPPLTKGLFDRIATSAGSDSRLALRDLPGEHGPVVLPLAPQSRGSANKIGRYELSGELAHGGMGRVLKGRDTELGRDVALKLLLGTVEPERLQRFIEEAQIAGQLQHPGVVPVHELGLAADGRPFFAMKLVKGRTLAALLEARSDPGQEARRFLSIFEQVCQTMAYAHARGVAHRDLKPANIMVGAFGEVLVMDWGLAKVLSQGGVADERRTLSARESPAVSAEVRTLRSLTPGTSSLAGSVFGTPAYMAPEQARGEVDQLDERADVFALGAILCEVLTGRPTYVGRSREELRRQAEQGAVASAFAALDDCGADPELIDLARSCLASDRHERPRDAGVVAAKLGQHLAAVEERAQQSRLQAASAVATARQERRARRLAVALAASIVLLVALGTGGYLWHARERGRRDEQTARHVGLAMQEASLLRGQAASTASPVEGGAWTKALAASQRAVDLARTGGAPADVLSRAERLRAELQDAEREAQELARQAEADRRFVEQLYEIHAEARERGPASQDAAYATAFQSYGIDVDAHEPEAAAERLRAVAIRTELAVAIDDWVDVRRRRRPERDWQRLDKIVRAADPDPWRSTLRDALRTQDIDRLRELARAPGLSDLPTESLQLLGRHLEASGDRDRAVSVLRMALRRHPDDYRLHLDLAVYLAETAPHRAEEALRFATAAVALRPRHTSAWLTLGHVLEMTHASDEAMVAYQQVLAIKPSSHAHLHIGCLHAESGDHDAAIASFRKSIRLGPYNASVYTRLGQTLKAKGDLQAASSAFDDAVAAHRKAIAIEDQDHWSHYHLGHALWAKGDLDGAIAASEEAIRLVPRFHRAYNTLGNALAGKGDLDGAIAAYREAIRLEPRFHQAHNTLGNALAGKGDLEGAIAAYREAIRLVPWKHGLYANLTDALNKTGDLDGVADTWRAAIAIEPRNHEAHFRLGCCLQEAGDLDGAIDAYVAALRIDPRLPRAHCNLGIARAAKRDLEAAITEFREAIRIEPRLQEAHYNLGLALIFKNDLDGAVAACRAAIAIDARQHRVHTALGRALEAKGDFDGAIAACREALRLNDYDARAHVALGQCLTRKGFYSEALHCYRRGHALGARDSARMLQRGEVLARLAETLPAILRGEVVPSSAEERAAVAEVCYAKRLYAAAAARWNSAFESEPAVPAANRNAGQLYDAACAAALAANGQGEDAATLDADARGRWRAQACAWLCAALAPKRERLAGGAAQPAQIVRELQHWKRDADLCGIREADALAALPESEREACRALWTEVDALLALAGDRAAQQPHGRR